MTEIDMDTRIELLLAHYSAMIAHLNEMEVKLFALECHLKGWANATTPRR